MLEPSKLNTALWFQGILVVAGVWPSFPCLLQTYHLRLGRKSSNKNTKNRMGISSSFCLSVLYGCCYTFLGFIGVPPHKRRRKIGRLFQAKPCSSIELWTDAVEDALYRRLDVENETQSNLSEALSRFLLGDEKQHLKDESDLMGIYESKELLDSHDTRRTTSTSL